MSETINRLEGSSHGSFFILPGISLNLVGLVEDMTYIDLKHQS